MTTTTSYSLEIETKFSPDFETHVGEIAPALEPVDPSDSDRGDMDFEYVFVDGKAQAQEDDESFDDCGRELEVGGSPPHIVCLSSPETILQEDEVFDAPSLNFRLSDREAASVISLDNDISFNCSFDDLSSMPSLSQCHCLSETPDLTPIESGPSESDGSGAELRDDIGIRKMSTSLSRLSRQKRRKRMKQMKKAAAAAAAAEALSALDHGESLTSVKSNKSKSKVKVPKMKNNKVANVAVACVTESLSEYRQNHPVKTRGKRNRKKS